MDCCKQLEENYADSIFALLMDAVGRSEREKIEAEFQALEEDADFAVPVAFDRRCKKAIRQYFASRQRHKAGHTARRVFVRIAVAVLICALLFSTVFAFSPTVRESAWKLVVQTFGYKTTYSLTAPDSVASNLTAFSSVSVGWIPEDYVLTEKLWLTDTWVQLEYENEDADQFDVTIVGGITSFSYNTEGATLEETTIQGYDATVIEMSYKIRGTVITAHQIVWYDTDQVCFMEVSSKALDLDTLIQIAESIQVER